MTDNKNVFPVVQEFIDACTAGNADRLRAIFHKNATMSGYIRGEHYSGCTERFFQTVENPPAGVPDNSDFSVEIIFVDISETAASVKLIERGFLGMDFTEYLHLTKVDDVWKIVSKTFSAH